MKKLLSFFALSCAMVLAFGAFAPRASAAALPTGVVTLKAEQTGVVQEARYRCWWRNGYRHCGYAHRGWRHHGYWHHRHWRHRYWRHHGWHHRGYWHNRHWRHHRTWRERYYGHRHYYYRPYVRPAYRPVYRYRPYAYCIGLCWW